MGLFKSQVQNAQAASLQQMQTITRPRTHEKVDRCHWPWKWGTFSQRCRKAGSAYQAKDLTFS